MSVATPTAVPPEPTFAAAVIANERTQKTRAWSGMLVVVGGDIAIVAAAVLSILIIRVGPDQTVAILTSAFTAIGSMTAAYFGIRAASNTADNALVASVQLPAGQPQPGQPQPVQPQPVQPQPRQPQPGQP